MIRDVTELREHGRVCRRVATLQIDPDTWRAGMRRAARREGMRIRTYLITPPPSTSTDPAGPLVYAVRTDLPPDHDMTMATINPPTAARLGAAAEAAPRPATPVTSLADQRARRSGHPCTGSDPD